MPSIDANDIQTLHLMAEGGPLHLPADTGQGNVQRPYAVGPEGGRVASFDTLYDYYVNFVADPDQSLQKDPDFLNKLYAHPDVTAAMNKRAMTVAQFDERIEANPDAPDQKLAEAIATEISRIWKAVPNREHLYYEMEQAVLKGGQGHEFVWHREAYGLQRPTRYFPVDKSRFVFDRLGNMALLTRQTPVWGTYVSAAQSSRYVKVPPRGKFVYHIHHRRPGTWQDPGLEGYIYYGAGEDWPLFHIVTFDNFVMRYRMKYIEKFGIPPYILYHPVNEPLSARTRSIIDSLRGESVVSMPKGMGSKDGGDGKNQYYAVDPLEVPTSQQDWFENFQEKYSKPRIYMLLWGEVDGGGKDSGQGGFSSDVHKHDTGPSVFLKFDAKNISGTLNSQLLPAMAMQRFPNLPQSYWPQHKLEAKEERDRSQEMEVAGAFCDKAPIAEDEFYERGGFRKPAPGEKTIGGQAPGQDPFAIPGGPGGQPQPLQPGAKKTPMIQGAGPGHKGPMGAQPGKMPAEDGGKTATPIGQGSTAGGNSIAAGNVKQRTLPRGH